MSDVRAGGNPADCAGPAVDLLLSAMSEVAAAGLHANVSGGQPRSGSKSPASAPVITYSSAAVALPLVFSLALFFSAFFAALSAGCDGDVTSLLFSSGMRAEIA